MKYKNLTFYSDPGHGWLRVPLEDVKLAVLQGLNITQYSYQSEKYAYLEEDVDATAWINFRQIPEEVQKGWKSVSGNRSSSIRNKERFKA